MRLLPRCRKGREELGARRRAATTWRRFHPAEMGSPLGKAQGTGPGRSRAINQNAYSVIFYRGEPSPPSAGRAPAGGKCERDARALELGPELSEPAAKPQLFGLAAF